MATYTGLQNCLNGMNADLKNFWTFCGPNWAAGPDTGLRHGDVIIRDEDFKSMPDGVMRWPDNRASVKPVYIVVSVPRLTSSPSSTTTSMCTDGWGSFGVDTQTYPAAQWHNRSQRRDAYGFLKPHGYSACFKFQCIHERPTTGAPLLRHLQISGLGPGVYAVSRCYEDTFERAGFIISLFPETAQDVTDGYDTVRPMCCHTSRFLYDMEEFNSETESTEIAYEYTVCRGEASGATDGWKVGNDSLLTAAISKISNMNNDTASANATVLNNGTHNQQGVVLFTVHKGCTSKHWHTMRPL